MRRLIAIIFLVAALGVGVTMASASPSSTAWDNERDAFDTGVGASQYSWGGLPYFTGVRSLRPFFQNHIAACLNQTTLASTRTCVYNFGQDLARPGPANSVAKDYHTATRRFGDDALHLIP